MARRGGVGGGGGNKAAHASMLMLNKKFSVCVTRLQELFATQCMFVHSKGQHGSGGEGAQLRSQTPVKG